MRDARIRPECMAQSMARPIVCAPDTSGREPRSDLAIEPPLQGPRATRIDKLRTETVEGSAQLLECPQTQCIQKRLRIARANRFNCMINRPDAG